MNSASRTGRERGLTLIELMAATAVLSIVALGVGATMANSPRIAAGAREENAVRTEIEEIVATLTAAPYSQVAALWNGRGFDVEGLQPTPGDVDDLPGAVFFEPAPDGSNNYYTVNVIVRWQGINGVRVIRTRHFLANIRGDTGVPAPLTYDTKNHEDYASILNGDPVTGATGAPVIGDGTTTTQTTTTP